MNQPRDWVCVFAFWASASAAAGPMTVQVVDQYEQPVPNALVMVSDGSVMPAGAANTSIGQKNAEFDPPISVVSRGTPVDFPNRDRARHHVYSFSPARSFEIELYKGTPSEPITFDKTGIVTIGCNVHDWMYGVVYVIESPYYAITDESGVASLDAPDGKTVALTVWHPDQAGDGYTKTDYSPGNTATSVALNLRATAPRPSRPGPIKPPKHRQR
ncbi:MAG: methylamine utilization protein [Pseudomonadota bacterium]